METTTWLAIFAGVSVALVLWLLGLLGLYMWRRPTTSSVNTAQPLWLRRMQGFLMVLSLLVAPWISVRQRKKWELRFEEAGYRHILQPETMVAAQVFLVMAIGGIFVAVQFWWDFSVSGWFFWLIVFSVLGWWLPRLWLRDIIRKRKQAIVRALPFILDMITLCVEAGLNLHAALVESVRRGPVSPLREELHKALTDMRTGVPRAEALRSMAQRVNEPRIRSWVATLIQAESLGMSLAPMLRAQAEQQQSERFMQAEKKAMEAPVKMLLPLALCIFPCTFIVLGFPILMRLMEATW